MKMLMHFVIACISLLLLKLPVLGLNPPVEENDPFKIKCHRNDSAVEEKGRLCGAPCTRQKTCRRSERICLCDGECGRSCVLKDLKCPVLENIENGFVSVEQRDFGSKAIYSCLPEYELKGLTERRCQGDGTWSDLAPTCKLQVRCYSNLLPRFDGVLYEKNQKRFYLKDEKLRFICGSRYDLSPHGSQFGEVVCSENNWVVIGRHCKPRMCAPFVLPKYSNIEMKKAKRNHGDVLILNCPEGYVLRGTKEPRCHLGRWLSNDGIPFCQNVDFEDEEIENVVINPTSEAITSEETEETISLQTTTLPEKEIDENELIPVINWTVDNGEALVINSKSVRFNVNSNVHLTCQWQFSTKRPSWVFQASRENENYLQNWNEKDETLVLTILSAQEDDSGMYTCTSPLGKRIQTITIYVTPNLESLLLPGINSENETWSEESEIDDLNSCEFRRPFNSLAWSNGKFLDGDSFIPDGDTVSLYCHQPGLFLLVGANSITCIKGHWSPYNQASCIRLKRNSETLPPSIAILSPHYVLSDGSVAAMPSTAVRLSCLWVLPPEPLETWYHPTWYQSTKKGNLVLAAEINKQTARNGEVEYYSYDIQVDGDGFDDVSYTCLTPIDTSHSIRIHFKSVCFLEMAKIPYLYLEVESNNLKPIYLVGERIEFKGCTNNKKISGPNYVTCLASGLWSNILLKCV